MKILHLMMYCPVPPTSGGALRSFHLLKNLIKRHEVTVFSYGTEEDRQLMIKSFGNRLHSVFMLGKDWLMRQRRLGQLYALLTRQTYFRFQTQHRKLQQLLNDHLKHNKYDIIQCEFPWMGLFRLDSDAVKILDQHNVEYDNHRRMFLKSQSIFRKIYYSLEYNRMYREEMQACKQQDAIFVTSERDKKIFDNHFPQIPKFVIPNGVETAFFQPQTMTPEPHSLVFSGLMEYRPNSDGILYFLDAIFSHIVALVPDAKLYIVGNRPPKKIMERAAANIIVTGYVDDIRPYVAKGSVYVVPLRMGGGTRLKILEAMSMKKPIVSTTIGCEGLKVSNGENIIIEDDPVLFAQKVVQLFNNSEMREKLVTNGYELVHSLYDWSIVGQAVEVAYENIIIKKK